MPETIDCFLNIGENIPGQNQNILILRIGTPVIILEKRSSYHSVQLSHVKSNEIDAQGKLRVLGNAILTRITYLLRYIA